MIAPKVSVLMPTYNTDPAQLSAAIDSILAQTFTDFEFLIIDDGSTNKEVAQTISTYSDKRIKFTINEKNLGISDTRNKLMELAKGEYIAIFDHDDISLPQRLEKQVEFLDTHQDIGVVGSYVKTLPKNKFKTYPLDSRGIEHMLACDKNYLLHPATMIRKNVLAQNDVHYNAKFTPAEDYDFFSQLIGKTKFANIPEVLFIYRWNRQNTSYKQGYKAEAAANTIKAEIQKKHPALYLEAQSKLVKTDYYRLFGLLPILSIRRQHDKTFYLLFGFLPLLKCKSKESVNWKKK